MVSELNKYRLGVTADSFESIDLAQSISTMTRKELKSYKAASHAAAESLSFEHQAVDIKTRLEKMFFPRSREEKSNV